MSYRPHPYLTFDPFGNVTVVPASVLDRPRPRKLDIGAVRYYRGRPAVSVYPMDIGVVARYLQGRCRDYNVRVCAEAEARLHRAALVQIPERQEVAS